MGRSIHGDFWIDNVGSYIHRYNRRDEKEAASKILIQPISPPHEQVHCPDNGESICITHCYPLPLTTTNLEYTRNKVCRSTVGIPPGALNKEVHRFIP
jgi:hypothetical protein